MKGDQLEEVILSWTVSHQEQGSLKLEDWVAQVFEQLHLPIYYYLLVCLGNGEDAEELTQEIFIKLYRALLKGTVVQDVRVWLFTVGHNAAINQRRSRERSIVLQWPQWDEVSRTRRDPSPNPEQALLQKERYNSVRAALQRLTEQERQAVQLRSSGLRYREIAEILHIGTTTVSDVISRALEKVKVEVHA